MAKKHDEKPDTELEKEAAAEEITETPEEASPLDKAKEELASLNDRLLRTLAEYDNFRKRSVREKEAAYGDSKAGVITELLPILDNFERAAGNKDASAEDYQKGIDMIFTQFTDVLAKLGAEPFGEKGDEFDPNIHNAVMHVDDENEGENTVIEVFSKGYKMGDRILRPAIVKVAN